MSVTIERLAALVKKIADLGCIELECGAPNPGLGLDYSYVPLNGHEIELWKEVTA